MQIEWAQAERSLGERTFDAIKGNHQVLGLSRVRKGLTKTAGARVSRYDLKEATVVFCFLTARRRTPMAKRS